MITPWFITPSDTWTYFAREGITYPSQYEHVEQGPSGGLNLSYNVVGAGGTRVVKPAPKQVTASNVNSNIKDTSPFVVRQTVRNDASGPGGPWFLDRQAVTAGFWGNTGEMPMVPGPSVRPLWFGNDLWYDDVIEHAGLTPADDIFRIDYQASDGIHSFYWYDDYSPDYATDPNQDKFWDWYWEIAPYDTASNVQTVWYEEADPNFTWFNSAGTASMPTYPTIEVGFSSDYDMREEAGTYRGTPFMFYTPITRSLSPSFTQSIASFHTPSGPAALGSRTAPYDGRIGPLLCARFTGSVHEMTGSVSLFSSFAAYTRVNFFEVGGRRLPKWHYMGTTMPTRVAYGPQEPEGVTPSLTGARDMSLTRFF